MGFGTPIEMTWMGELPPVSHTRWLDVSERPWNPDQCEVMLSAYAEDDANPNLFLRMALPDAIYLPSLDLRDEVAPPPDNPDVVLNVNTGKVTYADTKAAGRVQEIIREFPMPRALGRWSTDTGFEMDTIRVLIAVLYAANLEQAHPNMTAAVTVLEGDILSRHQHMLMSILWANHLETLLTEMWLREDAENAAAQNDEN